MHITLHISAKPRRWFFGAVVVLSWACMIVELVSTRLANTVSETGCCFLARYGVRYDVEG